MRWGRRRGRGPGASETGRASADGGGIANSGVLHVEQLVVRLAADAPGAAADGALTPEAVRDALAAYARRVRETYARLDMEVLTPLSDQGEHQPIELRKVFVPPGVREGAPPSTLPRELARRIAEREAYGARGGSGRAEGERAALPPGLYPEHVERAREFAERPVEPLWRVLGAEHHRRLVVLGDPGAGKSTLGRALLLRLTREADGRPELPEALRERLPLLVELRRCAEERWREATFEDFLDHLHSTEGLSVPPPVSRGLLRAGRAVVVFDGLDEIFDPADRTRTAQRIAAFASRYPDSRVVVTSRIVGYQQGALTAAGFTHYTLQDLTGMQIAEFARRWYRLACPEDPGLAARLADGLTDALSHSRAVRELAGNPLLLTILAIIGRRRTLPRDRQGVYEHAVTVLVAHLDQDVKHLAPAGRPEVREVLESLDARDLLELLRLLARHMQNGEGGIAGNFLHADELAAVIREFLAGFQLPEVRVRATATALVNQLRERNFILSYYGGGVYGFVHRAFLEYLAASDIAHRYKEEREWSPEELTGQVLVPRVGEEAWEEVLLLVTGQLNQHDAALFVDRLLARFRATDEDDVVGFALRALAEVRKLGTPVMTRCGEAVVDALTDHLTHWPLGVEALDKARPALRSFGDQWVGGRRFLHWVLVLGQFLTDGYVPGGPSSRSLLSALRPGTASHLVLARHAPEPKAREEALWAVVEGWPTRAGDTLRALLRERAVADPAPGPRAFSLTWLAQRWPEEHRELFQERATDDPAPFTRHVALRELARWPDAARPLWAERAVADPDPAPRGTALRLLAAAWPRETRELVLDQLTSDPDPRVRANALETFIHHWPDEARGRLEERAVADDDPVPRHLALAWLTQRWPGEARGLLEERAVADPDPGTGSLVRHLLGEQDPAGASLDALRRLAVSAPDANERALALDAYFLEDRDDESEKASGPDWHALLRARAVEDPDWAPRETALECLVEYGPLEACALWRERAVHDPHHRPRATALKLLVRHRPDLALAVARERAVNDPHPDNRLFALRRWAVAEPESGAALVARMRDDEDGTVRAGLAWSLAFGWCRDEEVLDAVRALSVDDPDDQVRAQAAAALAAGEALAAALAADESEAGGGGARDGR
ncbi:HEAT repeat-containing protein [Streptomyces zhaozhouensis]|uniref:HEAT repeat-containing protein n=1 Tax=Streptomyces zhaozhouensis TaxID=1300267 RepID=A0A286E0E3_9ACTN|nr:HEAT repeat domain-containing protein [Streptomyces zhaozhouensis]SOD64381.1 HEAT repeat-containing protein [Streptomyces zhaozhouensis]